MNMDLKSEKNVTRSDIARAAGVSVGTVSNVLNNTAVVKEDLRQKVLKTVKELHYVQNYTAKSLASKNNHHIGVAVYEMSILITWKSCGGSKNTQRRTAISFPYLCWTIIWIKNSTRSVRGS